VFYQQQQQLQIHHGVSDEVKNQLNVLKNLIKKLPLNKIQQIIILKKKTLMMKHQKQ
jgi:hypothetical protein